MEGLSGLREGSAQDELPYLHQAPLVERKYENIGDMSSFLSKSGPRFNAAESDATQNFVGILERPPADFQQRAIEQWTAELKDLLSKGESEFINILHHRTMVQQDVHNTALASQARRKRNKGRGGSKIEPSESSVPAIVRLGVLTMFPLIEALSTIPGANYDKLCAQTLDIVIKTIGTLPPLALSREPSDVLDAFKTFISRQIESNDYSVETAAKSQALIALLSLVISQGRAQHLFHLLDILFKVHFNSKKASSPVTLPVGASIRQLIEHGKDLDIPLPFELLEDAWTLELLAQGGAKYNPSSLASRHSENFAFIADSQSSSAVATDGKYLYIQSPFGLVKVGTGLHQTIRGHCYATNASFRASDKWCSLVCIGNTLYYWSPELSYETYRPAKLDTKSQAGDNTGAQPASSGASSGPPLPRICHVILVISTETLLPTTTIRVDDSSLSMQSRMISDGKYLMFVGKQRGKGTKSTLQQQQSLQQQMQQQLQASGQSSFGLSSGSQFASPFGASSGLASNGIQFPNASSMPLFLGERSANAGGDFPGFSFGDQFRGNVASSSWNPPPGLQFLNPVGSERFGEQASYAPPEPSLLANENPSDSISSDEDEDGSELDEDEVNEDDDGESVGSEEEEQGGDEDEQYEREHSPQRRSRGSSSRNASRDATRPRSKEEEDAVTSVVCVEWFDVSVLSPAPALTESMQLIPELANILTISPLRSLEIPARVTASSPLAALQQSIASGDELLPANFGSISFYTNGLHLVAVCRNGTAQFRVYSLIDGKPLPEITPPFSAEARPLDARDAFTYDPSSGSIWAFRGENTRCARYHNMGPTPCYEDVASSAMQIDSAAPKVPPYAFPQLPSLSPEVTLNNLDVWAGAPKKARILGLPKQSSVVIERTLKENLTALECICVITASMDRLARHHWGYKGHAMVDESHVSVQTDFNFTTSATTETIASLYDNLRHALNIIEQADEATSLDQTSSVMLSFLRLLKLNLHFFCSTGKSNKVREDQRTLFNDLRDLLVSLAEPAGLPSVLAKSPHLQSTIVQEAAACLCVGFFTFFPQPKYQIDFLKNLTERAIPGRFYLHDKLMTSLATYYRVHEILLEDAKMMMDIDQPDGKVKKTLTASTPLASSNSGLKDKAGFGPRELPFHPHSSSLFAVLLRQSVSDSLDRLKRVFGATDLASAHLSQHSVSPTLRLLLSLQMEVVSLTYLKGIVVNYFDLVSKSVVELLAALSNFQVLFSLPSNSAENELPSAQYKAAQVVLECSVLGTLLPSLLQALSRKAHVKDPAFVVNVFDKLCELLSSVDRFNQMMPEVALADQQLSLRSHSKSFKTKKTAPVECEFASGWLLDLQSSLALLARKCVVTLLEGEPTSEKERQCQDWLDTRLINGGIDENPQNAEKIRWLEAFAEGKQADALYAWIKSQGGPRPHARPSAKASLERAERYALAAMMKHAGLADDAQVFTKALVDRAPLSSSHVGRFSFIAKKSAALASLLTRRAELQKTWQVAVQDKVNDFDAFSELVQRTPDRLYDFCDMQGIEPNPVNNEETIKRLMQKLQEEIALMESLKKAGAQAPPDIFELLCAPVIERASFLIKLLPSNRTVKHPAADSSNPYATVKNESKSLRASAPGSKEGADRGYLTKSMSHLPTTESAQQKVLQRATEEEDNKSFSQRVGELRSWLHAYAEWEHTVLRHNRTKRDEPPPTSPIQGVVAFTTNQSITVKDWERVLRVQATRAKSREQGLIYLRNLLSLCHFAAPRHQLLGSLSVSHYLDGIQSSGQSLTSRVTDLFGELFISLAGIVNDTSLDYTSRLLALNVCAISYTENDALLLSKADIFQLLHNIMSEKPSIDASLKPEAVEVIKSQQQALHDAAWTCFRLFAAQVVSWRHHDGLHFERSIMTKLQQQAFDVFLLQLRSFSETLVDHDLSEWHREILVLEPHAGHGFAFELVFLLRLLSEASKAWTSIEAVPTLLKFLSSRTAPRAQRVVLRLLRKLLPTSTADKLMVNFCLDEMGKWIFAGKLNSVESGSSKPAQPDAPTASAQSNLEKASGVAEGSSAESALTTLTILSSVDSLENIIANGSLDPLVVELLKNAHATSAPKSTISRLLERSGSSSSNQTKPLPLEESLKVAALRAKFGDVIQVHEGDGAKDFSAGAAGKNDHLSAFNPVYWADGAATSMLASEYIALLRYLYSPMFPTWMLAVRETLSSAVSVLPNLVSKITSDSESLAKAELEPIFRALSALSMMAGFPEPIRVGCKVVVTAPLVSQAELVTGTVVSYAAPSPTADVILDSEVQEEQNTHTFDVKQLRAISEIGIDVAHLAPVASSLIPSLLAIIKATSTLDSVPTATRQAAAPSDNKNVKDSSSMDVDASASQDSLQNSSAAVAIPAHHYQNLWLYQELKAKTLCVLELLLQHPEGANFMVKNCSESIPTLLKLAQEADSTTYMEKIEGHLTAISARLWDLQTIPGDLHGKNRRNSQGDSRGMTDVLPHFWNAGKANALPTGLDKSGMPPGTVILDEDARIIQIHSLRGSGHSGNFGRPTRGGLSRFGGREKGDASHDVSFIFGNCLIPSKGLGQYYFELQIHGETSVERPSGSPKPLVSIGLVPDPQTSGPTSASSSSSSSYRQSSYRGGDVSMPFPPGSYCYLSTRNKAWVVDGNLRTEIYGEPFGFGSVVGCLWDQNERTITFTKDGEELDVAFRNVLAVGDQKTSSLPERLVPCVSAARGIQFTVNFGQTPFRFSPILDDALDAAAREAKRKEAEEKRQKAIQEEQAKRKAEQEQREAIFNEDASLLLSMGFCARHCLRAMMHAGWSYKNRWVNQEGVLMAANWLTEASPDQLGPAGDLPSESAPAQEEAPKPAPVPTSASKKKLAKSDSGKASVPQESGKFRKPVNPENEYSTSKSSEYVLGDAYSLGAPRRGGITLASVWRREILPRITSDIPFPSNDPTVNQLIAYAETGNEDALKSNLTDLYNGKIPAHIRLPSQLKIVEPDNAQLKMTQISPDMSVQIANAETGSPLARFVSKSGLVLDRDLKQNLVLVQFVSSEEGSLEEWWFHVTQLARDRSPTRPYAHVTDAASLHLLLASRTQQYSYFAARRALLSLLRHAPLAFDVTRAKRDLEELARAALLASDGNSMDVDPTSSEASSSAPSAELSSSAPAIAAQAVSGAIDVQDAIQLISREYLTSPEILVSSQTLFSTTDSDDGINFAGVKLVELLTRAFEQQGADACAHLLNTLMQKCIGLMDLACHFTNLKTLTFSHQDSTNSNPQAAAPPSASKGKKGSKDSSSSGNTGEKEAATQQQEKQNAPNVEGVTSMPNYLHKVHVAGARACILMIHSDTDRATRLNVYLDEDLTDQVNSIGGASELDSSMATSTFSPGGPFQPILVPSNTFWVKARQSTQAASLFAFGGDGGKTNLEYRATVVPVSSDIALARWIAEFLTLSTTTRGINVPLDFAPLINTIIDFLYATQVPTILKESIMALLSRIIHELRYRSRGQAHKLCQFVDPIGAALDLSRLNILKKEMISLYDSERRSASNSDNAAVKKRGAPFTSYLQGLVELMVAARLYENEKLTRQKMLQTAGAAPGASEETVKAALALAHTLASEAGLSSSSNTNKDDDMVIASALSMFSEEDMPEGPMVIPAEGEEDSSTSSEGSDDGKSPLLDLFASGNLEVPPAAEQAAEQAADLPKAPASDIEDSPSKDSENPDSGFDSGAWGQEFGDEMELDDELAQAIALSMRESEAAGDEQPKNEEAEKPAESGEEEKKPEEEEKKDESAVVPAASGEPAQAAKKPEEEVPAEAPAADKKEEKKEEKKPSRPSSPAPVPSAPKSPSAMDVDKSIPPPPPQSAMKSVMNSLLNRTPTNPSRKSNTVPTVADPSWFSTLVAAAQALENFAEQNDTGVVPPICIEAVHSTLASAKNASSNSMEVDAESKVAETKTDPLALQFTKDSIRVAWNNIHSQDFVRHRLYLVDQIPTVEAEKRAELATALEELVEEKALVVDGSLYLPIDHTTKRTKNWMIVEVHATDNMPSVFTFKDPNFTGNKSLKLDAISIRRLLEKSRPVPASAPISSATASVSSSDSAKPAADHDIHYDEPDATGEPTYAHLDARWREYVRSRLWDKKSQHLTREFRDALTETFLRFCTDHTLEGVMGKPQLSALQAATGGEAISDADFEFYFSFGTKTHTYVPTATPKVGESAFMRASARHSSIAPPAITSSLSAASASEFKVPEIIVQPSATSSNAMQVDEKPSSAASVSQAEPVTETGLTLDAFLVMYTNQALQLPMTTLDELSSLGYDLHLNRTTFKSLAEAEQAIIEDALVTPKSDLELVRYLEQILSELDVGSPLLMTISHIKSISKESHLSQIYPRLVRFSMPLLCLRFEMIRQLNQKVNEVFSLMNMGGRSHLSSWLSKSRGLIFHSLKMNFVYNVLERTADDSSPCPSLSLNRIDISANKDHVMNARTEELFIKKTAFGQAFTQLQTTDPAAFRRPKPVGAEPHFAMRVVFQKENVQGDGGPYRQFFTDIAKELAEVLPLLVPCPNAQSKIGNNRDKFLITPSSNSSTYLKMYRFLGQLMGMAMRTGVMLAIDLPSFFWKPLVGTTPTSQDIRDIDHSFHTVLKYLKTCSPDVFQGETRTIFDHFQTTLSDKSKMLLKPGGDQLEVTYDNRLEYCRLAEAARINESYLQILEVRRGLADFVPLSLLNMFTWRDLQWRVCGRPQIDLKLLKRHTEYAEGLSPTAPHIRYFWQVLRSFSQEDRRAFVRFAWAQERLPADDQEFSRSQTRMMIKHGPVSDNVFPTADTCFFNLSLPAYSSPDILRERLLFAIHTDGAMDNDRPNPNDHDDR